MGKVRISRRLVVAAAAAAIAAAAPQAALADSHVTLAPDHGGRMGVTSSARPVVLPPDRQDGLGSARLPTVAAPVVIVRTVSSGGFEWVDAAVGAAVALALVLVGVAMRLLRTGGTAVQER